jgi:DNA polymerase
MRVAVHGDFETRSTVDLRKAGVYRYAIHPTTGIWMLSWRYSDWPVQQWRPSLPFPQLLIDHVASGGEFVAHNAAFERLIWNVVLPRYVPGLPKLTIRQMHCTMARAYAIALPGPLELLTPIVMPGASKDMEGHALMKKMAKPRKIEMDGRIVWWDAPELVDRLGIYCDLDIEAESGVDERLPQLSPIERQIWELDQTINDRGVRIDRRLVTRAIDLVDVAKAAADKRMAAITDGAVTSVGQTKRIVDFVRGRGVPCDSLKKGGHDEIMAIADLIDEPKARAVVELRRDGYKSSTAKLPAMLACASETDDRMRGLLAYHATTTGRWAGRLVQPQNFPRVDADRDLPTVLAIIELLLSREPIETVHEILTALYGEVMPWMAKMLRACLIARDGHELVGGDLSNIEGRVNAWMAGETWKLKAFADYDAGTGPDLYKLAYARSFGTPVEQVGKTQRQLGKVQELASGYQGSIGAYLNMVDTYQMKLADIVGPVRDATPREQWERTGLKYTKASSFGLPDTWWVAIKILVDNWRASNAAITQSWWDRQDAAIDAVLNPNILFPVLEGRIAYMSTGDVLLCRLPSGRPLQYWNPRIVETPAMIEVLDEDGNLVDLIPEDDYEIGMGLRLGQRRHGRRSVQYDGVDRKTKKWGKRVLYGGLQCENDVSGTSRDVLVNGMLELERIGYPLVLSVHDEALAEVPEGFGSEDEFARVLATNPAWLAGCPLSAAAWRDRRYVK